MQEVPKPGSLTVRHFADWNPLLDEALTVLPEMSACPHELFRLVAANPGPTTKRFALVSNGDGPVAVVAVRRVKRHWEQIGHGIMPGTTIPALPGYEVPALAATGLDIWFGALDHPPESELVRASFSIPVYRMDCSADFEAYWHRSGLWDMVKKARRKMAKYTLEVNAPGAATWVLESWAQKWRTEETESCADAVLAAEYYEARGLYHTFRVMDGDTPIAGSSFFVDGDRLVYQTTFFDETYRRERVGTALLDLVFQWAAGTTYRTLDIGGGHDYKELWAPEDGQIWSYNVCPQHLRVRRRALDAARGVASLVTKRRTGAAGVLQGSALPVTALVIAALCAEECV